MRIAAWDIETTDLKALFGNMLCSCVYPIHEQDSGVIDTVSIDHNDPLDDEALALETREQLSRYDLIVTWNGKLFDLPFLNARLMKFGHEPFTPRMHLDLMYKARGASIRIGSSKLDNVAKYFNLGYQKTPLEWETWRRAGVGNKESLDEVMDHCEADVRVLNEAYWTLCPLITVLHR